MLQYFLWLCLLTICHMSCGNPTSNDVAEDKELVFAMAIHRHGERTPDSDELSLYDQQEKLLNLTRQYGLESLTNAGKRRAYQIGKFIRHRYSSFHNLISNSYLHNEIGVRSTDKERTKMTVQVAMAAAYPPEQEQQWDEGLGRFWQPIPYTALPLSQDYLRYYSNCERFSTLMEEAKLYALNEELAPYLDLVPFLAQKTGRNFTENPLLFETLFDLFRSLAGLNLDIPEWAKPLQDRLSEAARLAYNLYFRTFEMKKIGGGVLLNTFIEAAEDIIRGKPVDQRLRIFSAHDFNIGVMMEATGVISNHSIPEYGSLLALELYRSKSTGSFSVMPVYLPQAGSSAAKILHFKKCEGCTFCDYSRFKKFTSHFLLSEHEFYKLCNIKLY